MVQLPATGQSVDHDAILNIIRLAHAQSQKLAEQWVPVTKEEFEPDNGNASLKESFLFRPEQAGLGADISQAATSDWRGVSIGNTGGAELEKLRRQLLGRKAVTKAGIKRPTSQRADNDVTKTKTNQKSVSSSDDEEGGRATAFKSKRIKLEASNLGRSMHRTETGNAKTRKTSSSSKAVDGAAAFDEAERNGKQEPSEVEESEDLPAQQTNASSSSMKQTSSFLDEILMERRKKKRKRKRKNHGTGGLEKE